MHIKSTPQKFRVGWVFFFLVIFCFSSAWASLDVHFVDDPSHYFGELEPEHAIAIGTDGDVYIAYGGDNLYLAIIKETLEIQTVDANGIVGKYPSMALDKNDDPHISYYDGSFGKLKYAHWNGSSWQVETIDTVGSTRAYTAIAIDSNARPHISYHDFSNHSLKYAHFNGTTWDVQTLDASTPSGMGQWSSIAIDSADNPHIGYYDWDNDDLKYITWKESQWKYETVDTASAGQHTSIALDQSDNVHLSYYDALSGDLQYAYRDASTEMWSLDTVEASGQMGRYNSLVVDSDDQCHISYYDEDNGTIKYAKGVLSSWSIETVETVGTNISFELFTSIAVDGSGVPHLAYGKQTGPRFLDLRHAYRTGSAWSIATVDSSQGAIESRNPGTSIAIDQIGNRHISYVDRGNYRGNSALKYAFHNATTWETGFVDTGQSPTEYYEMHSPAIAVDSINRPHISYAFSENFSAHTLKYARWDGSAWRIEPVVYQSVADISMALDSSNQPHISFKERGNNNLLYAHWTGAAWDIEVIEYIDHVGDGSSIAIDSNNYPHISYLKNGSSLNYARWNGSSWQTETIVLAHLGSTSIALDSSGRPHISYQYNEDLMYAHWSGSAWNIETVDSTGTLAWDSSLALDSANNAHICYYDKTNENLKYAYRDGSQWEINTVDGPGEVGRFCSIAIDTSSRPHMSYVDMGNMALKYAVEPEPFPWILFIPAIIDKPAP